MVTEPRDFVAVVVAAGSSRRIGGGVAKQFLDLGGRSVLAHSVSAFAAHSAVRQVVVVLEPSEAAGARGAEVSAWDGVRAVVAGGASRSESVRCGLLAAPDAAFVLVHDAARPFVRGPLIDAVVEATRRTGAAIPGLAVADTVKRVRPAPGEAWVDATLDRGLLRLAQTPQGARRDWLLAALERAADAALDPTDEAAALEAAGHEVEVVPGDASNVKITTRDDLDAARRRWVGGEMDYRVGSGYDIHRFAAGRRLVLGGVEFPGEIGLEGHSDTDVVLHAAMDAVLGAAALGDIGALFPPDDPGYSGADSAVLAADVARRAVAAGWTIVNLDLTLIAERPRIRDRVDAMREATARAFGIEAGQVGLKATTAEGIGALGRGDGAACQAVALLRRDGSAR